jgi:hypothetical protein
VSCPPIGVHGGRGSFGGRHLSFPARSNRNLCSLGLAIPPHDAGCQPQSRGRVQCGRPLAVERKPSSAAIWEQRSVSAGGGWYGAKRQGPVGSRLRQRCPRPWRPKGRAFVRTVAREGSSDVVRIMAVPTASHPRPATIYRSRFVDHVPIRSPRRVQENGTPPTLLRFPSRTAVDRRRPPPLVTACGKGPESLGPRVRR